jgi:hypothetical protein
MQKQPPPPETNRKQGGMPAQSRVEQARFCQEEVEGSS